MTWPSPASTSAPGAEQNRPSGVGAPELLALTAEEPGLSRPSRAVPKTSQMAAVPQQPGWGRSSESSRLMRSHGRYLTRRLLSDTVADPGIRKHATPEELIMKAKTG